MEEHRCTSVASEMEDARYKYMPDSGLTSLEDPRYNGLQDRIGVDRLAIEAEDCRCNSVGIRMEDPRCTGLQMKW